MGRPASSRKTGKQRTKVSDQKPKMLRFFGDSLYTSRWLDSFCRSRRRRRAKIADADEDDAAAATTDAHRVARAAFSFNNERLPPSRSG